MRKILATMTLALLLTLGLGGFASAQTAQDTGTTYTETEGNDTDFGWIGLLGLAGLLGMRRREVHHTDAARTTTAHVNR